MRPRTGSLLPVHGHCSDIDGARRQGRGWGFWVLDTGAVEGSDGTLAQLVRRFGEYEGGGNGTHTCMLSPGSTAARAGVLRRAVRLTAARTALQAECERLRSKGPTGSAGAGRGGDDGGASGRADGGSREEVDEELACVCTWFNPLQPWYKMTPQMMEAVEAYGRRYDDAAVEFSYMLVGVRLTGVLTKGGKGGGKGGKGAAGGGGGASSAAEVWEMVSWWVEHHARVGFDHLVLCVDGLDELQAELVRRAAHAVLYGSSSISHSRRTKSTRQGGSSGGGYGHGGMHGGSSGGDHFQEQGVRGHRIVYDVITCGSATNKSPADVPSSPYSQLASRARWSVLLPDVRHYVSTAAHGTVQSVVLSLEAAHPDAGALCLPAVPWTELCRPRSSNSSSSSSVGGSGSGDGGGGDSGNSGGISNEPRRTCDTPPRPMGLSDCVLMRAMPSLRYDKVYTSGGEAVVLEAYGSGGTNGNGGAGSGNDGGRRQGSSRMLLREGGDSGAARPPPTAPPSPPLPPPGWRAQHRLEVRQVPWQAEAAAAGVSREECVRRTTWVHGAATAAAAAAGAAEGRSDRDMP